MAGTRRDSNQELIGQGIANLIVPLFSGFAATGAFARTATNIRNGATSPLAGLVIAVNVGVGLSILQFLRSMAASAEAQPANELALRDELLALGCAPLANLSVWCCDCGMYRSST
jgi:MFS superfamily sulfate permease-like transporter